MTGQSVAGVLRRAHPSARMPPPRARHGPRILRQRGQDGLPDRQRRGSGHRACILRSPRYRRTLHAVGSSAVKATCRARRALAGTSALAGQQIATRTGRQPSRRPAAKRAAWGGIAGPVRHRFGVLRSRHHFAHRCGLRPGRRALHGLPSRAALQQTVHYVAGRFVATSGADRLPVVDGLVPCAGRHVRAVTSSRPAASASGAGAEFFPVSVPQHAAQGVAVVGRGDVGPSSRGSGRPAIAAAWRVSERHQRRASVRAVAQANAGRGADPGPRPCVPSLTSTAAVAASWISRA